MNDEFIQKISTIVILAVLAVVLFALARLALENLWYIVAILLVSAGAVFVYLQVKKGSD